MSWRATPATPAPSTSSDETWRQFSTPREETWRATKEESWKPPTEDQDLVALQEQALEEIQREKAISSERWATAVAPDFLPKPASPQNHGESWLRREDETPSREASRSPELARVAENAFSEVDAAVLKIAETVEDDDGEDIDGVPISHDENDAFNNDAPTPSAQIRQPSPEAELNAETSAEQIPQNDGDVERRQSSDVEKTLSTQDSDARVWFQPSSSLHDSTWRSSTAQPAAAQFDTNASELKRLQEEKDWLAAEVERLRRQREEEERLKLERKIHDEQSRVAEEHARQKEAEVAGTSWMETGRKRTTSRETPSPTRKRAEKTAAEPEQEPLNEDDLSALLQLEKQLQYEVELRKAAPRPQIVQQQAQQQQQRERMVLPPPTPGMPPVVVPQPPVAPIVERPPRQYANLPPMYNNAYGTAPPQQHGFFPSRQPTVGYFGGANPVQPPQRQPQPPPMTFFGGRPGPGGGGRVMMPPRPPPPQQQQPLPPPPPPHAQFRQFFR